MQIIDKIKKLTVHKKLKYSRRKLEQIKYIAIHHSATLQGSSEAFARYHVRKKGWPGIGYIYVVNKNGSIDFCNEWNVISYHVGHSNRIALGICLVGDFTKEQPTELQLQAAADLCQMLIHKIPSIKEIKGHCNFPGYNWKTCPAFDVMKITNLMKSKI